MKLARIEPGSGSAMLPSLLLALAAMAGGIPPAMAAVPAVPEAGAAVPTVEVPGTRRDRDEKSYRDMVAAMDVFDKNRGLAPAAALRFKVLPRRDGVSMQGLALQIAGDQTRIPLALADNQTFAVPRDADAALDNAMVRFNRKAGSLAWRADIRSPGLPPNTRRLGDLLLECKVAMAGDLVAYVHHPLNMMITKMADPCRSLPINMFYFADRPVFSITLIAGARRGMMPAAMLHGPEATIMADQQDWPFLRERVYLVKFKALYDKGWPDDTLLQFEYMDDDSPALVQTAPAAGPRGGRQ